MEGVLSSNIRSDLQCPITGELLNDPITVPCCGKAFSRAALVEWMTHRSVCPLCNHDLDQFDAVNACRNTNLAGLVESFVQGEVAPQHPIVVLPSTVESAR